MEKNCCKKVENDTSIKTVLELCNKVGERLIGMYPNKSENNLIFPVKRDSKETEVRVSEQEARFLFANEITKQDEFNYGIEVPTTLSYGNFSTNNPEVYIKDTTKGRSGSIDLSLYKKGNKRNNERIVDIEFKFGPSKYNAILKDVLKLVYEPHECGIFFHVLEHSNRGTLKSLYGKFDKAFKYIKHYNPKPPRDQNLNILFFIVVLEDPKNKEKRKSRIISCCIDILNETISTKYKSKIE